MQKEVIAWKRRTRWKDFPLGLLGISSPSLQGSGENLLHALTLALRRRGCPVMYSHCLESGVTFSISSMKFFRNSVLLSEAFKSLQYSLRVGRGKKSGLGGAAQGRGLQASRKVGLDIGRGVQVEGGGA